MSAFSALLVCGPEEIKMTAIGWKGSKTKTRCFLPGTGEQFSESRIASCGNVGQPASDVWAQRLQGTTQASWSSSLERRGREVKVVENPCVGDSSSSLSFCGSCGGRMGLSFSQQLLLPVKFHTPLKMSKRLSDGVWIPCYLKILF